MVSFQGKLQGYFLNLFTIFKGSFTNVGTNCKGHFLGWKEGGGSGGGVCERDSEISNKYHPPPKKKKSWGGYVGRCSLFPGCNVNPGLINPYSDY